MPVNFQRLGIFLGQEAKIGIFFERTGKVDQIAVGFGGQSRIRQPRADGFRNIERGRAPWEHPSRFHPEASHECCLP
jgi:hypothetical protein